VLAGILCALLLSIPVSGQNPSLLFGQSSGVAQVVKSTSNALWVSLQAVANVFTVTRNALGTTSTDGVVVQNTTAATGGVPVQISPRVKLCGTADNTSAGDVSETDCFIVETLPATVAGATTAQFNVSSSIAGGAYANKMSLTSGGKVTFAGSVTSPSIALGGAGQTNGDVRLSLNGAITSDNGSGGTASLLYLKSGTNVITIGDSGNAMNLITSMSLNGTPAISSTAPTISSGFNTTPTITNGTAFSFAINTGATPATNTGVIGLPTATNGWSCAGQDLSDGGYVNQVASTVSSASFKYYSRTLGTAINWPASATIVFLCGGR